VSGWTECLVEGSNTGDGRQAGWHLHL